MAKAIIGGRSTNYPYAVARVQAKRGRLIPRAEYEKILKMDVSEITRFIQESEYKPEVDELSSRFQGLDLLEAALSVNEERTYAQVRRMLQGEGGEIAKVFLARHLVDDIKTILRGKNSGASRDELLRELLLEDLDTYNIFLPLLAEDVQTIADVIEALEGEGGVAAPWARALRRVPEGGSLPQYEDALDKAYYARLLDTAKDVRKASAVHFKEFVKREIDARNLQNAARWVATGQAGDFTPYIIPGGRRLDVAQVAALAECADMGAFDDMLQGTDLYESIAAGLARSRETGRLVFFAVAVQRDLYSGLDRLAHRHPLSIIPILSFLLRKHDEVRTLRAVARGRAAGLSEERLREVIE
jgi:V/A-type H+-transporting ATPase subunit C